MPAEPFDAVARDAAAVYADPGFARRYAARLGNFGDVAFYERRAALELLPPLQGLRLLDAGCGPGLYAEWLARQGAEVTGLDASEAMLELARQRCGRRVRLVQAGLDAPLPFADQAFDAILCAMVLQHLRDWTPVLREFARLIPAAGCIVLSTTHPFADLDPGQDYFALARLDEDWADYGVSMPCWRRSFGRIFADVAAAGLLVETLTEPRAKPQTGSEAWIARQPWVLCLRLRKP